jgi:hypothetical protein
VTDSDRDEIVVTYRIVISTPINHQDLGGIDRKIKDPEAVAAIKRRLQEVALEHFSDLGDGVVMAPDDYEVTVAQSRIAELEREVAELKAAAMDTQRPDGVEEEVAAQRPDGEHTLGRVATPDDVELNYSTLAGVINAE